jgi:hypothetical protein
MKTIYVLTAWNPKRHDCNIVPFKSVKAASKSVTDLFNMGFNEFLLEKRSVSK